MAVPTIISVTPNVGHTGGRGRVEIRGTNFRTWTIPPFTGVPSGPVYDTVQVLFGTEPGLRPAVISAERMYVTPPRSPLAAVKPYYGEGTVGVTVKNLLPNGSPIYEEQVTLVGGYKYRRENLADEAIMTRLVRTLVREMRLQITANVSISTHSDFDQDWQDNTSIVDVARLPGLALFGPTLGENRFYSLNGYTYGAPGPVGYEDDQLDCADTDDLYFTFVGVSDQKQEVLGLQASVRMFFRRNKWLYFDRHPTDPSYGRVKYDMTLEEQGFGYSLPPDQKSNLKSFSGTFSLRGFDHEELAGFALSERVGRVHQVLPPEEPTTPTTPTDPSTPLSSNKTIVNFVFPEGTGVIGNGTIEVKVPLGTDRSHLTPAIVHNGVSISPSSGVAQNFNAPVTYVCVAEDGSTRAYVVSVTYTEVNTSAAMKLGTNFWYHTRLDDNYSGESAMKPGISWATAYGPGTNGLASTNIWNEVWLAELAPYAALRFMDWGNTNWSQLTSWSQRRLPTDDNYEAYIDSDSAPPNPGVAYEWMIDVCNRQQKDLWVCVPAQTDMDFWTQLAVLVKAKLASNLKVYVEYSNETWNGSFGQFAYVNAQGVALNLPGGDQYRQGQAFCVRQSFGIGQAFQTVFGVSEMGTRVVRVFSIGGDMSISRDVMRVMYNNSTWNPSGQVFDMLAMAPYIGSELNGAASNVQTLFHAAIDDRITGDDGVAIAVAYKAEFGISQLGCYEGGQHLLANSQTWTINPYIYDEYRYMLDKWSQYFTLFVHYTHTGKWTNAAGQSSWGALDHTGQSSAEAHKYRALTDWKLANP